MKSAPCKGYGIEIQGLILAMTLYLFHNHIFELRLRPALWNITLLSHDSCYDLGISYFFDMYSHKNMHFIPVENIHRWINWTKFCADFWQSWHCHGVLCASDFGFICFVLYFAHVVIFIIS